MNEKRWMFSALHSPSDAQAQAPVAGDVAISIVNMRSGDHFVCYAAVHPSRFPVTAVTLQDQFDVKRDKDEILTHLQHEER